MNRIVEQSLLYDFYGELLNDHQRRIYEAANFEDLSLSEIAQECGISRQGVHDLLRRTTRNLETYENKLHLIDKFVKAKNDVARIHALAREFDVNQDVQIIHEIEEISNNILEEI